MQIIIACGSMPFGPNTPSCKSLGGSETAALMLAKALGARGHDVAMFCNLPARRPRPRTVRHHQTCGGSISPNISNLRPGQRM
jgi:hypothetical protein